MSSLKKIRLFENESVA
jgi:hypothetical protein